MSVGESEEEGVAESGTVENESGTRPPLVTGLCYQVYDGLSVPASDHEVISAFGEVSELTVGQCVCVCVCVWSVDVYKIACLCDVKSVLMNEEHCDTSLNVDVICR